MLVIGHRGAAGLAPENTLEALRAGVEAGADMLEFDVRLTKDGIPVLIHDVNTIRTHREFLTVSRHTLRELQKLAEPLDTLEEVLDEFFGKILLNIEIKGRGNGKCIAEFVEKHAIKRSADWDTILFSSFSGLELRAVRKVSERANLALLHADNPFNFIAYQRSLHLTAVGFHRHYIHPFALLIAKKAELLTYAYTVDRPMAATLLAKEGVDGVVTNFPDRISKALMRHN